MELKTFQGIHQNRIAVRTYVDSTSSLLSEAFNL